MRSIPAEERPRSDASTSARLRHRLLSVVLLGVSPLAAHASGCAQPAAGATLGARIAAIACAEHERWYSPFIDAAGRLASVRVSEAETAALRDGTPAWQRVAQYWHNSGVGWPSPLLPEGTDCNVVDSATSSPASTALCRTFLVDTPWSAVFVSYVMTQAGVPGFAPSARHVDYVRSAYDGGGPYRMVDPLLEAPSAGDLLCFVRQPSAVFGYPGLREWLEQHPLTALNMHCDVVVSTRDAHARLVGGNVLQGVTMRMLPINRAGRLWNLPRRTGAEVPCDPDRPTGCNLNRQDWVALLKLDRTLTPVAPASIPSAPCCTACRLPMPPGLVRCDAEPARSP